MLSTTMSYLPAILATIGLLTSPVHGIGCFTSGEEYNSVGNAGDITSALATACDTLATSYTGNQQISVCSDFTSGNRVNWKVLNNNNLGATLSSGECNDIFQREIDACSRGSIQNYVNWQITDDPNAGPC